MRGVKTGENHKSAFNLVLKFSAFFKHQFIHVTPKPILTWLNRFYDRMLAGMEMLGRMLVLRRIAAAYMSALKTQTKVNPCVPDLYALFTNVFVGGLEFNLIQMSTFGHAFSRL